MEKRINSYNPMMNQNGVMRHLGVESISIISSCGCNLKCSYCLIAQSENIHTSELQNKTIQAFQDGSFLQNVINSLLALNQSPAKIRILNLWGQEPTLTIHYLTEHWDEWQKAFPSIEKIFFSTNGMAHGDRLVEFVKAVDKFALKDIDIQLQVSYDGDYGTNSVRNANGDQIKENIKSIVNGLNDYKFNKTNLMICFHGVMSQDLIKTLTSGTITQDYFNRASSWTAEIAEINRNHSVHIEPGVGYIGENPVDASAEQGVDLTSFYKKMIKVNPKYVTNSMGNIEAHSILSAYQRIHRGIQYSKHNTLQDALHAIVCDEQELKSFIEFYSHNSFCGTFYGELKFMYDGTILGCQNSMYEKDPKVIDSDGSIKNASKIAMAQFGTFFVDPMNDDIEKIERVFDIFKTLRESSFYFTYCNTINLMLWLLECHQIDESYKDIEKLMAHAFYMTLLSACVYNNYIQVGTYFGIATGTIRYFCNGFLDCILDNDEVWGGVKFDAVPAK